MIISEGKNGIIKILIYNESIICFDKEDSLRFVIDNEHLKYTLEFSFSSEGKQYTTTYWEDVVKRYLHYRLNNWDSGTYVEIGKPIKLNVPNEESIIWMKFRNHSPIKKSHRKFELSIWKEVKNGK